MTSHSNQVIENIVLNITEHRHRQNILPLLSGIVETWLPRQLVLCLQLAQQTGYWIHQYFEMWSSDGTHCELWTVFDWPWHWEMFYICSVTWRSLSANQTVMTSSFFGCVKVVSFSIDRLVSRWFCQAPCWQVSLNNQDYTKYMTSHAQLSNKSRLELEMLQHIPHYSTFH